ncbi:SusC/RagA family TonB-linked outer membrane protein [Hymenobacter sp. BT188]|uniref:SusC/RagA family TonB-linked outer membrane protein n=1 Tax=Hymenobacter sp. BT188 TaxID=2763504 RepID=UPI001651203F|nr:SusC/RagA family TonB-linked outer membrane protein [Hymenobacter sp. BT188]MBC6607679.1 SusC/RagA family TonB-linked outer membrane protein [Hymenobacter sp. BT188]
MKHPYLAKLLFLLLFICAGFTGAFAQTGSVSGRVLDEQSQGLPGVTVLIEGTSLGNSTNADGTFSIQNVPAGQQTLVVSFIGYTTKRLPVAVTAGQNTELNATLGENTTLLNEAVVVGYGTQRRQDVTGSVATVDSKDFVQGQITNPEQLINGKVAGVQITTGGGAPGSASSIRIRGGASLNATNEPLIVIDGVPIDGNSISGAASPLSTINPNDIETYTVLKDASATAIYGSRASNGVIIITTKKGLQGEKLAVAFSTQFSRSKKANDLDILSPDQFRAIVNERGTDAQKALVGAANTNWQDVVFQSASTYDNNLSLTGALGKFPFRVSGGYLNQDGILRTSNLERITGSLSLTPVLLNDNLRLTLNAKGSRAKSFFADEGAIGAAINFDPTKPVTGENFGGYYEWTQPNGNPITVATRNPLGLLEQRRDQATVDRFIGNVQFDYRLPFLTDLRAVLNLGMDRSSSTGTRFVPAEAGRSFARGGENNQYAQDRYNKLLDFYLNYVKQLGSSRLDLTGGYSYQDFIREEPRFADFRADGTEFSPAPFPFPFKTQNTLVSFFGRAIYNLKDRYIATATFRADGTSRFGENNRFGYFPALGLAWNIKDEAFMKDLGLVTQLKLRGGYGITGQQDLETAVGNYPFLARYTQGDLNTQIQVGYNADGSPRFVSTLRPEGYNTDLKWEETTTYNAGLDYGILDDRISGSIDVYRRETKDLLAVVALPAGSNLINEFARNIGTLENRGIEVALNVVPVRTETINWSANFNVAVNKNEITSLNDVVDPNFAGYLVGDIAGGTGNRIQINSVGYAPNAFYVYKQVYDTNGSPIEGVYADLNNDGQVTELDKYRYKSSNPKATLGFSSNLSYQKFNLAFTLRSYLDNYVYNNVNSDRGTYRGLFDPNNFLGNLSTNVLETNFVNNQFFSDYYVENASFLRMDNITLGYNGGRLFNEKLNFGLTFAVQNLFVISDYKGLDPEIFNGIDRNFYPRPRTFTVGLNLGF